MCMNDCHRKDKLFILFDNVTFNCEDKCCRLHIYVYDADFLLPGLCCKLVCLSTNALPTGYSIDAFFMGMFCQVFTLLPVFFPYGCTRIEID